MPTKAGRMVLEKKGFLAEPLLMAFARGGGDGRTIRLGATARRQMVIVSVLESLRQHLFGFTLSSAIEEIRRWAETGRSCFARWAEKLGLTGHELPDDRRLSLLDRVIPVPDG